MSGCDHCAGSCGGCARELTLTPGEIAMLEKLAQIPFLPIARRMEDATPIYLEDQDYSEEEYSLILQLMEKKGLIIAGVRTNHALGRKSPQSVCQKPAVLLPAIRTVPVHFSVYKSHRLLLSLLLTERALPVRTQGMPRFARLPYVKY